MHNDKYQLIDLCSSLILLSELNEMEKKKVQKEDIMSSDLAYFYPIQSYTQLWSFELYEQLYACCVEF